MPDRQPTAATSATSNRSGRTRPARSPRPDDAGAAERATEANGVGSPGTERPPEPVEPQGPQPGWPPRDFLAPFVLLAVSLQRAHGYVIEDYLRALGLFGITMSTLYRTLRQMEKDGYLESAWEPGPTGPARRVYTITDAGNAWLDSSAAMLGAYRDTIDRFFGLYGANSGTSRRQPHEPPKEQEEQR